MIAIQNLWAFWGFPPLPCLACCIQMDLAELVATYALLLKRGTDEY